MRGFLIGTAVTALAFAIVTRVLPQFVELGGDLPQLILVALIFGVVNGVIKPIVKLFSLPITVMTLGLFSFVINAGMLLLVAWVSHELFDVPMSVGGFPGGRVQPRRDRRGPRRLDRDQRRVHRRRAGHPRLSSRRRRPPSRPRR